MTEGLLTACTPFPEQPPAIADYQAARIADTTMVDAPAPWDLGALSDDLVVPLDSWLDEVCRWLNSTFAWQPYQVIPPCWRDHGQIAYEVAALAFARSDAMCAAASTVSWHEQLDRFVQRMNTMLGRSGDECRAGRHADRPARYQLGSWQIDGNRPNSETI
ncbi:hypothetical protein [Streptomyces jumonjinensis]|uniref:Uncharacterized protein n=1 Tax=Streptomyces jumonjinensis TaxID=1945 RepID=A0A646KVP4_STRJU|nr:hypothetical protein [Streptomyces jumonjinensis]MQT05076.1 hypothetical protein [Streptomyces jumonjinensis]